MPSLEPRPVRASATQLADLTNPPNANVNGTVFGGFILQLVDKAAAVCAMRHAGGTCVTVAMERVEFLVPVQVGHLVIVEARLNHAGRTSMEVGVEVYAENLEDGSRRHTNSCLVTMVAIGPDHKPRAIPPLKLEKPDEKRRFSEAEARREARRRQRKPS